MGVLGMMAAVSALKALQNSIMFSPSGPSACKLKGGKKNYSTTLVCDDGRRRLPLPPPSSLSTDLSNGWPRLGRPRGHAQPDLTQQRHVLALLLLFCSLMEALLTCEWKRRAAFCWSALLCVLS